MAASISLRPPTTTPLPQPPSFTLPPPTWLSGTWHVTHSTLPMWKSKRNITITYNPLPASSPQAPPKLESTVAYQTTSSDKIKTVKGIETPSGGENTAAWDWRGKGWLVIASSHWEVLGWGELEGGGGWAVTYFAKTLFTPAGIDIYSRGKEGVGDAVVAEIKNALGRIEHEEMRNLGRELFEIQRD